MKTPVQSLFLRVLDNQAFFEHCLSGEVVATTIKGVICVKTTAFKIAFLSAKINTQ
jgi:hypothetical protein